MKMLSLTAAIVLSLSLLCACNNNQSPTGTTPATPADNTARNQVDRNAVTTTPTDQGENTADIKITAAIRQAVMSDNSLSTNAHNAKIVTNQGAVTLRGVVNTPAEKDSIESKAKAVTGVTSVDDQLEIKNP